MNKHLYHFFYSLLVLYLAGLTPSWSQQLTMDQIGEMEPRNIGPAGMSGRVTSLDVNLSDPSIMYLGSAAGGLWKSTNSGDSWKVIFDNGKSASIGAVKVYQKNPNIIWAGTGEGNPRNSENNGAGIYKSIDGGKSWQFMGLENTRSIHRIIINPDNPDIVLAASLGASWGENPERGVYKTVDGGKSWRKVLYVNEKTGAADMVVDPENPNKIIAAMWEYRRWPWFFKSGGPGSGIYVSMDGGESWEQRTQENGLPEGEIGRTGLAIAPSNTNIVYAWVESKENAIYRSEDGGETFERMSSKGDKNLGSRPFYYADIFVDPKNENRVYSVHSTITVTEDGGKNWDMFAPGNRVHTDHHVWWIHPEDPNYIVNGNDGGLLITDDRGETWRFVDNLPLGQFYHVRVDNEVPYNVYGGLQNNGSWRGPSQSWFKGGIRNLYWQRLSVGDGFDMIPDPKNNRYGWSMGQAGNLVRYDRKSGQLLASKPQHPEGEHLRFNWNAGIAIDPHDNKTIYYGSQYVHKSSDYGKSWEIISPDLTTDDPTKQNQLKTGGLTYDNSGAENHTSIITIVPSELQEGLLWVGTDDGNLQLTRDGGKTWTNLTDNIKEVPDNTWIPHIHASTYNAGEAFVVFDGHRNEDWTPYVFQTTNYGKSWDRIVGPEDARGATLSFVQDPVSPNLMFCGTEFGLYLSTNGGDNWFKWTAGYGSVPVQDMVIHPREHDLVLGTFGRSFYILDDLKPLQEIAADPNLLSRSLHAFSAPDAWLANIGESHGYRHGKVGDHLYNGENRPYGALLSFYLDAVQEGKEQVKVEIFDEDNRKVRTLMHEPTAGINRLNWELERAAIRQPNQKKPGKNAKERGGFHVLPGTYTVRYTYNGRQAATTVNVKPDPRLDLSMEEMTAKDEMIQDYNQLVADVTSATDKLRDARKTIELVNKQLALRDDETATDLMKRGRAMDKRLESLIYTIVEKPVQGFIRDHNKIAVQLGNAGYLLRSTLVPVSANQQVAMANLENSVNEAMKPVNTFFTEKWPDYRNAVENGRFNIFNAYETGR